MRAGAWPLTCREGVFSNLLPLRKDREGGDIPVFNSKSCCLAG